MGKTRDPFKKIRDTKGTFHAKMGIIKDINGMDLTETKEIIVKINKTKSQFFQKINKIDKPLARLIKEKKKNQINKIRNEKGEVITDNAEIHRIIIKDYYEQLYGNIMDNLEEMDRLLEKLNI